MKEKMLPNILESTNQEYHIKALIRMNMQSKHGQQ